MLRKAGFTSRRLVFNLKKQAPKKLVCVTDALEDLDKQRSNHVEIYGNLLRQCGSSGALSDGKRVHDHLIRTGHGKNEFLLDSLIQMYGNCGDVRLARAAFDLLSVKKPLISFNQMLAAYVKNSLPNQALDMYHKMCLEGPQPDKITYFIVLGACSAAGNTVEGREVHTRIRESLDSNLATNVPLQNAIVNMYGKCGCVTEAREVFDSIKCKDRVSWTSMIATYANNGYSSEALDLFTGMESEGIDPDNITYTSVLLACTNLSQAREIHKRIESAKIVSDFVSSALINTYSRLGETTLARSVFDRLGNKHVVCWTALMTAYLQKELHTEAMELYMQMLCEGVRPDGVAFVTVLGACGARGSYSVGREIHEQVKASGFTSLVIDTALLSMYSKCGRIDEARCVFDSIRCRKNVYCWTAMISAYAQVGDSTEAGKLYEQMVSNGTKPNEYTLSSLLAACWCSGDLEQGRGVHEDARKTGLSSNIAVRNALVTMYAKCGSLELAKATFEEEPSSRDTVTWNAMIAAYAQHGHACEALELCRSMKEEGGLNPDEVTVASSLAACAVSGDLRGGEDIHARVTDALKSSPAVRLALVNMYGRCGKLETAKKAFETGGTRRDSLMYTAMTGAYAHQGHALEALNLYIQMAQEGVEPNQVTFSSVLVGCSRGGLLAKGVEFFLEMQAEHGVVPDKEHYLCMVDLLGRCGRVKDAEALVETMPYQPDVVAWLTLLGCCKTHSDADCARRAAEHVEELQPGNTSLYSLLSSVFSDVGLPEEALMSLRKNNLIKR